MYGNEFKRAREKLSLPRDSIWPPCRKSLLNLHWHWRIKNTESHSAIALCDFYASLVLSNLPRAPITRRIHASHEPIVYFTFRLSFTSQPWYTAVLAHWFPDVGYKYCCWHFRCGRGRVLFGRSCHFHHSVHSPPEETNFKARPSIVPKTLCGTTGEIASIWYLVAGRRL